MTATAHAPTREVGYTLDLARRGAESILGQLRAAKVLRAGEVAGSIRRGTKARVKDIDLVVVPTLEPGLRGCIPWSWSEDFLMVLRRGGDKGADGKGGWWLMSSAVRWSRNIKLGSRRDRFKLRSEGAGCCELWCCEIDVFGWHLAIRTGPKDFGQALMSLARLRGFDPKVQGLYRAGEAPADGDGIGHPIPCRDEAEVFAHLGARYVEPAERGWETLLRAAGVDPNDPSLRREHPSSNDGGVP